MRRPALLILPWFLFAALGCGGVKHLSLSDPRLPIEARRWLADAEDEVAITHARVVDAQKSLKKIEEYRSTVIDDLKKAWATGRAAREGEQTWQAFKTYTEERVSLARIILNAAEEDERLAEVRLMQARAETATRYDIAVYEIGPIAAKVEALRGSVAALTKRVEAQRVQVEKTAATAWQAFYQYAQKGGITNALWYAQ